MVHHEDVDLTEGGCRRSHDLLDLVSSSQVRLECLAPSTRLENEPPCLGHQCGRPERVGDRRHARGAVADGNVGTLGGEGQGM